MVTNVLVKVSCLRHRHHIWQVIITRAYIENIKVLITRAYIDDVKVVGGVHLLLPAHLLSSQY